MDTKDCECEGTGYVAVADSGGDGVEYIECAKHHPAFEDVLTEYHAAIAAFSKKVLEIAGRQAEAMRKLASAGTGLKEYNEKIIARSKGQPEPKGFGRL